MAKCEMCNKGTTFGKTVSHRSIYVTGRSNKKVRPNLRNKNVVIGGIHKKITICTRCLRTLRKTNLPRQ